MMTGRKRQDAAAARPTTGKPARLKGQTLRLTPEIWLKLKLLAAVLDAKRGERVTQHSLLLEAVDDLLIKYRRELPRSTSA